MMPQFVTTATLPTAGASEQNIRQRTHNKNSGEARPEKPKVKRPKTNDTDAWRSLNESLYTTLQSCLRGTSKLSMCGILWTRQEKIWRDAPEEEHLTLIWEQIIVRQWYGPNRICRSFGWTSLMPLGLFSTSSSTLLLHTSPDSSVNSSASEETWEDPTTAHGWPFWQTHGSRCHFPALARYEQNRWKPCQRNLRSGATS